MYPSAKHVFSLSGLYPSVKHVFPLSGLYSSVKHVFHRQVCTHQFSLFSLCQVCTYQLSIFSHLQVCTHQFRMFFHCQVCQYLQKKIIIIGIFNQRGFLHHFYHSQSCQPLSSEFSFLSVNFANSYQLLPTLSSAVVSVTWPKWPVKYGTNGFCQSVLQQMFDFMNFVSIGHKRF